MTAHTVPVAVRQGVEPTPMQRGLLASQHRHPTSPLQNTVHLSHFEGPIDPDRLARAFDTVVAASDVLRSQFAESGSSAQVRIGDGEVTSSIVDVPRDRMRDWAIERAAVPIDIAHATYDSVIARHDDGTASWYLALHHTVTDATSSQVVYELTAAAYAGAEIDVDDYYGWWWSLESDARTRRADDHWRARTPAPRTARLYRQVSQPDPASERVAVDIDADLRRAIDARLDGDLGSISDHLGWTVLLMTAAAAYLHRLTGADRLAVGLPVHNRSTPTTRRMIGPLMEVFPVDVMIEENDSFRSLHQRVARSVMATLKHARPGTAPAASDCEAIVNVVTHLGYGPFGDVPATTEWVHSGASDPNHLFRIQLSRYGDDLDLMLDLNHAAADVDHRWRAPGHFRGIVTALVDDPDRAIVADALCSADEVEIIRRWGSGSDPGPAPPPITIQLEAALRGVDEIVVEHDGIELTGDELWSRAAALARSLRADGVGSTADTTRVGFELDRSIDAVVAIIGILLAGGSYVPLDPAQPVERRRRLAARADCVAVLDRLPARDDGGPTVELDAPRGDREAYLLFTSGSTGEPKGVPIDHAGLARYVQFALESYVEPGVAPVAPLFSALTFDLTVTSLFVPLLAGGRLVVIGDDGPSGLAEIARRSDLTWCKATPSHLELLLRLDPASDLRTLVVGGEAFHARTARRLRQTFPHVRVFNEYGPTEAVVGCMIHEATPETLADAADVPIGRPAPGVSLRIVDPALHDVPIGASGELIISHDGITSGYLDGVGDEDDGEHDPFVELDGSRWYRSGDLVRLTDPSTLVYLGRIDAQIKTGGIRLEPTEVEHALTAHPAVARAAVRLWSPTAAPPSYHCVRCGLPSNVPGIDFDDDGVCETCHAYERIKHQAAAYFRTPDELLSIRDRARRTRAGRYDCLHLLSGGKDSTYALYQLVEHGFDVRAMTLDNGYISEGAKENVRRSVADLGIDHEFVTSEAMDDIFRDSLERHSNVCNGCYKTLYTLATSRADELGIPVIVTGLSRGQLFETRLVPQQFDSDRFDPDAIDRAVVEARRSYHRVDDGPHRLLDTSVFDAADVFDRISYVDFYRYVDVELAEMLSFLDRSAPWVRPADTGRSTNCLINAAGIHTHLTEQGYHNYAIPYAWDVRLGHKTRQEAIDELDDDLDLDEIAGMLGQVGYEPAPRRILTAWYELADDAVEPQPAELRTFLGGMLPTHAVPAAFVVVEEIPVTVNGKLDEGALPEPARVHRSGPTLQVSAESEVESTIVEIYERVLRIEPVGVTDDFFDLGGDSLAALGLVVELSERLGRTVREALVFANTTPRALAEAIGAAGDDAAWLGEIESRAPGSAPPLSAAEQAMLFEHLNDPTDPRFNVGHLFRVRGPVDVARFVDAIRSVFAVHGPLTWTYGEPRRALSPDDAIDVLVRSGSVEPGDLAGSLRRFHVQPFDLDEGPVARCVVQPLVDGSTGILIVVHHIAVDAAGFDRLWAQIDRAYSGAEPERATIDYGDHAAWQADRAGEVDLTPWLAERFADEVRFDGDPDRRGGGYLQRTATFTTEELRTGPAATPFGTSLAALAVVLRARCDGDRVGLGLTVSTREHPAASELVGLFLNTIPIAVEVGPLATFETVAAEANRAVASALAIRATPLSDIVAARRRAGVPAPPVNVLLAFEDWMPCRLGTAHVDHEVLPTGSPVADVTFFVQVHGSRVELSIEYRHAALADEDAVRLLADVDRAIRAAIDRPRVAVSEVAIGPPAGAGPVAGPAIETDRRPLQALITDQAARDPAHPAIRLDDVVMTYGELDRRSNQLAHELRARGARPGRFVGVAATRRPEMIVLLLGVLKSGAAYVPIDPDYPPDRIRHIIDDADLAIVVTSGVSALPGAADPIALESLDLDRWPPGEPDTTNGPDDPAYVIYTSGSTGRPKGVVVRHRNIVASTLARAVVYPQQVERFLLLSSFAFDSSMVGILWTLCSGGTLVLPPPDRHEDVLALDDVIERFRITHLLALPSLYRLLLTEADDGQLASLDTVIVAGEVCPYDVVALHRRSCPNTLLANEYGPTEGTVWSHAFLVDDSVESEPVPIGTPIPGVVHLVLDATGAPVRAGQPGELYIGGAGVAAGYLGHDELTRQRFLDLDADLARGVPGPWYRTGDTVRADANGRLDFVGRVDDQVKVRGVRIEPGEVVAALVTLPAVDEAVVGVVATGGRDHLTAWFVPSGAAPEPTAASLRAELAERLPSQLVPSRFVALSAFPLGPNGKVDRGALPPPDAPMAATDGISGDDRCGGGTSDERATALAAIWADALGVERVGLDDNFFDLGGDSIISLQIVARARRAGIELRPRQVFDHQTVRELMAVTGAEPRPAPDQSPVVGEVPLSPIQRWFFEQDDPVPEHWNQTIRLDVDPDTDVDALVGALESVRTHHDQLRARFDLEADPPRQVITEEPVPALVHHLDLDEATDDDIDAAIAELEGSLDLRTGRIVGVLVCRSDGRPRRLEVTMHHLVVDGVSWSPIIEDWATAYAATIAGRQPSFPARSTSFREWSEALIAAAETGRFAGSRAYWQHDPVASESDFELRRSPANVEGAAGTVVASLDRVRTDALVGAAAGYGDDARTVEDVLLAAVALVIPRRLHHPHLGVVLEGHGREDLIEAGVDLSRTVGWFTTHYPIELTVSEPDDPGGVLAEIRDQLRSIPARGVGFGVDRHLGTDPGLRSSEPPIVAFNYLGQLDRTIRAVAPFTHVGELRGSIAAANRREHLLGILALIRNGRLTVTVEYLPAHLDPRSAAEVADELIEAVAMLTESAADGAPESRSFDLLDQSDADAAQLQALLDQLG